MLEQANHRILRWSLRLDGYDFDIEYKVGKYNYVVDLLTCEVLKIKDIKVMTREDCVTYAQSEAPHGFCLVLICESCRYCMCWSCFGKTLYNLPSLVLHKILTYWVNKSMNDLYYRLIRLIYSHTQNPYSKKYS